MVLTHAIQLSHTEDFQPLREGKRAGLLAHFPGAPWPLIAQTRGSGQLQRATSKVAQKPCCMAFCICLISLLTQDGNKAAQKHLFLGQQAGWRPMPSWIGNTVGFGDAVSPGSTGRHRDFILWFGFRVSQAFALTWVGVRNRMAGIRRRWRGRPGLPLLYLTSGEGMIVSTTCSTHGGITRRL